MNKSLNLVKQSLLPKASTTASVINEGNINQSLNVDLFRAGNATMNNKYVYATLSGMGSISFHKSSPFKFIDSTQSNPNYRSRFVWASFATESNPNKNNPDIHYNSNGAMYDLIRTARLGDPAKPNPYNCLSITKGRLRNMIVPASVNLTDEQLQAVNTPVLELTTQLRAISSDPSLDDTAKVEANKSAFNAYLERLAKLMNEGLLIQTTGITTPEQSSVNIGLKLEDGIRSQSNPWLDAGSLFNNPKFALSSIPSTNDFRGLIEIISSEDMETLLDSDNTAMIGHKTVQQMGETARYSLAKIAVIRDYNSDTIITVSVLDPMNGASRVGALESLLEKGQNILLADGTLSPVVRKTGTDASANGNIFFELKLGRYEVYNSHSNSRSLEANSINDLDFETVEVGDIGSYDETNTTEQVSTQTQSQSNSDLI